MANKKFFTSESLTTFIDEIKAYVTSAVSGKANSSHSHAISDVTNLQTTLDGKQASVTGGASTITSSNLTASRALVSNSSGKVAVSAVTSTELGYLDGVTSNIQIQLDGKTSIIVSSTEPTNAAVGAFWLDTSVEDMPAAEGVQF